jgi:hypothetical protein
MEVLRSIGTFGVIEIAFGTNPDRIWFLGNLNLTRDSAGRENGLSFMWDSSISDSSGYRPVIKACAV